MSAPLGRNERVDLVDDHRIDAAERLPGIRRQEKVQRLRGGDEDVRRISLEARALDRWRVAGPDRDRRRLVDVATRIRPVRDSGQRRPKIPLDIDRQRLERRDIQDTTPPTAVGRSLEHQPVDAPEKRRERLAAAGGRQDQRRSTLCDRRPSLRLRWRGFGKGVAEPFRHGGMKELERIARGRHTLFYVRAFILRSHAIFRVCTADFSLHAISFRLHE